ncbi:MAG: Xaa-Pro peptidase family protein [Chloroflexota bacterium]|nr:Xaa-Pro peptidase family protein [Chloroflexota bacterium]
MSRSRLEKLRQKLAEKEIDAILISQPENRHYLSGFTGSAGYLLISPQKAVLATDFRYVEQAAVQAPDFEIARINSYTADWISGLIAGLNLKKLGFEAESVTFAFYRWLSDNLKQSQLKLVPVESLVESLRAVKEPAELDLITKAVGITDRALEHIEGVMRPGMTEIEAAWEIEKFMREQGSQTLPFEIIVAAGPNGALPHHQPSARVINSGEPVVVDIGAKCGGYCSDMTRTFCPGAQDDKFRKVYDTVLGAQLAALSIIKEGMTGEQADSLARTVIEEAGYGQNFGHGLGHGVGLAVHELPRLGAKSTDVLSAGMVFTVEPGIYLTGWGGVRIEDVAAIENGKARVISKAKKT